jgi:hypothetical protein
MNDDPLLTDEHGGRATNALEISVPEAGDV